MAYSLKTINDSIARDPDAFVRACDETYAGRIIRAADMICENVDKSPLVLLAGPSGSGKTTTSKKLADELKKRGIETHSVAMDNYFRTIDPKTAPRAPDGDIDLESPLCLDMELLNEHFSMLSDGREIMMPHFDFAHQRRDETRYSPMRLGDSEIAIFEGIHALSDMVTDVHPEAFTLYISAASNVEEDGRDIFTGTWMRLVRRCVRDSLFRGSPASFTLNQWNTVLDGEDKYITPNIPKADMTIDSSFGYEVPLMKPFIAPRFSEIGTDNERFDEVQDILAALEKFDVLDERYVSAESILREFIGGGVYKY